MKHVLTFVMAFLAGCHSVPVHPPPETFDQFLQRTEGVTCADITAHEEGSPAPDCHKLYDAFVRGRNRVVALYPQASVIQMKALSFLQTKIRWNAGEVFPRMDPIGSMAETVSTTIFYAFEETLEHETTHALVFLVDGGKLRSLEAINDPRDADQKAADHFFEITCHNTFDDPFGDGTSRSVSGRAGCIQPYSGTPNPL